MKKTFIALVIATLLPVVFAIAPVQIEDSQIQDIGYQEIFPGFGMIRGSIVFKLGEYSWAPKEIWLLPEGTNREDFKATSTYLELPENLTFSTCKTSVYYNETTGKYAFKILSSAILPNGTFCGLAYGGTYNIYAK